MSKRLAALSLLVLGMALAGAGSAAAQALRADQTWYVRPYIGVSSYVGDNNAAFLTTDPSFPWQLGAELGYQFTYPVSLGLSYHIGNYPQIQYNGDAATRSTVALKLRYLFGGQYGIAPYVHTGLHATFGKSYVPNAPAFFAKRADVPAGASEETHTGFGPLFGAGVDIPVSGRVSLFLEGTTHLSFGDDKADGIESGRQGSFDWLSTLGGGLKINFKSGLVPVDVMDIEGPASLEAGQEGVFTATANEAKATRPVTYRWDWGDGSYASELTARHTYARPGTYTVTFTASNRGSQDTESMTVTVVEPKVAASISGITADPMNPDTDTAVRFSATVAGTAPVELTWDFGDGETATGTNPSHTYAEPGSYTVTARASNVAGNDTESMTIRVRTAESAVCSDVADMNTVYFGANSSTLTSEGRASLRENLDILRECPRLRVRVQGYAAPTERNTQALSEDRARAVEDYYVENGVSRSRVSSEGRGRVSGTTSKKDSANQMRRVDTIPER